MANQGRVYGSFKRADWARPDLSDVEILPGVYTGIVKEIIRGARDGSIRVFIPAFGTAENDDSGWVKVGYASPFMGQTSGFSDQLQTDIYEYSSQSYGFFMALPDVGNQVLCCFPIGKGTVGFWFACISNKLSKITIPASAPSTKWDNIDPVSLAGGIGEKVSSKLTPGIPYPVGDFNGNDPATIKSDWVNNLRPINGYSSFQLIKTGLESDITRGAITSSIQRDAISSVYGFNTPGRPMPSQDPANIPELKQKIQSGTATTIDLTVNSRVPGHSFVMDDGDIDNKNNLVRLKTAAGHQVLMNDSEGFIYVSNSEGTAWIELTKEGDILIYNSRDLCIRSKGNVQLHSDSDILMNAKKSIRLNATDIQLEGSNLISALGTNSIKLEGGDASLKSRTSTSIYSGAGMNINSSSAMKLNGSTIDLNSGGGTTPESIPPLNKLLNPDGIKDGDHWVQRLDSLESICYKIPTHEPYIRGNIASVAQQQQEITSDSANQPAEDTAETPAADSPVIADGPVKNPAPASAFITQSDPGKSIGSLNNDQLRAYMAQTGHSESSGNYSAVNKFGYAGKYQLGSAALQDLKYVKAGTPQTTEALRNPNNWIGGPGKPASLDEFLSSQSLQDQAMTQYTQSNYNTLARLGVVSSNTPPDEVAGLLSASHLKGAGATANWYNGTIPGTSADAFGTTIESYYQQGKYSQTQVPTIVASNASKYLAG